MFSWASVPARQQAGDDVVESGIFLQTRKSVTLPWIQATDTPTLILLENLTISSRFYEALLQCAMDHATRKAVALLNRQHGPSTKRQARKTSHRPVFLQMLLLRLLWLSARFSFPVALSFTETRKTVADHRRAGTRPRAAACNSARRQRAPFPSRHTGCRCNGGQRLTKWSIKYRGQKCAFRERRIRTLWPGLGGIAWNCETSSNFHKQCKSLADISR